MHGLLGGMDFDIQRLGLHFAKPGVVAFSHVLKRKTQAVFAGFDIVSEPTPAHVAFEAEGRS